MKAPIFFYLFPLIVVAILFFSGFLFWTLRLKKNPRNKLPVLVYHKIGNRFEWGITRQKVRQFEEQMKYLKEEGYQSIRVSQGLLESDSMNRMSTKDSKRILITFDDGYESVYSFAFPILERYGFTALIFLITGYVGKYNRWDVNWGKRFKHLSWDQIKEMNKYGFSFGSHTVNHPDLTKLEKRYVEYELKRSKEELEDRLSQKTDFLSFPFGKYNQMVENLAQRIGYQRAFTICSHSKGRSPHGFVQGRLGIYLFDSALTLRIKLNRGGLFWIEDLKGRIINAFANGTALVKRPDYNKIESESISIPAQRPTKS